MPVAGGIGVALLVGALIAFMAGGEGTPGQEATTPAASASSATATPPSNPSAEAVPAGVTALGQPYVLGNPDAQATLSLWEDMECPACAAFEFEAYNVLTAALNADLIKVEYFIAPTDRAGSVLSALAVGCAADQSRFKDMQMALFTNQFPDNDQGFSPEDIVDIAGLVEVPDLVEFEQCLTSERYAGYAASLIEVGKAQGISSTPEIYLDGRKLPIEELGWEGFVAALGLDPEDYPYEDAAG